MVIIVDSQKWVVSNHHVNVIVDDEHGDAALAGITRVFAPDSEKDATA